MLHVAVEVSVVLAGVQGFLEALTMTGMPFETSLEIYDHPLEQVCDQQFATKLSSSA